MSAAITITNSALIGFATGWNFIQGALATFKFRTHGDRARVSGRWVRATMILNSLCGALWLSAYRTFNVIVVKEDVAEGYMRTSAHLHAVSNFLLALAMSVMMTTQFELALSVRLMVLAIDGIDEKSRPWAIRHPRMLVRCLLAVTVLLSIGGFAAAENAIANLDPETAVDMLKEKGLMDRRFNIRTSLTQAGLDSWRAYYGMDFGLNLVLALSAVVSWLFTRRVKYEGTNDTRFTSLSVLAFLTFTRQTYQVVYSGLYRLGPVARTSSLEPGLWMDILSTLFTLWTLTFCTFIVYMLMRQGEGGLWLDSSPPVTEKDKMEDVEGRGSSSSDANAGA